MASSEGKREPGLSAKQGSRLHAKMLSKEAAAQLAAPSFRVYYSVASAGAVPFLWESRPGTPKNDSPSAAALPPLTPPPSYYAVAGKRGGGGRSERRRGAAAVLAFLRRPGRAAAPSSSSRPTTSATASPVFTVRSPGHHRRTSSAGEGAGAGADEARCFGMEPECCERGIAKGCSVVGAVRSALATVVGGAKPAGRRA